MEMRCSSLLPGTLSSFGPTAQQPTFAGRPNTDYNDVFIAHGAIGNIGQRRAGVVDGTHFCAQEANIGPMPPTVWADWRVWLYWFAPEEGVVPTGASHNVTMLNLRTHKGSTAVGNPSWQVLACPSSVQSSGLSAVTAPASSSASCLFVSYFLFGEGAKPGEAGVLAFWKQL
jgi:hypothetical protein